VKRRKAGASDQDAQPRKRQLVGQCAFRRFASLCLPEANLYLPEASLFFAMALWWWA
jgi:hypothetical protein